MKKCMKVKIGKDKRVYHAKLENILKKYKIATPEETIEEIINGNKSISRYGDRIIWLYIWCRNELPKIWQRAC